MILDFGEPQKDWVRMKWKSNPKIDLRYYAVFSYDTVTSDGKLISRKVYTANPKILKKLNR